VNRRGELVRLAELFGLNLLHGRRAAGLSQRQLAERVGMRQQNVGELERGRGLPRLDTIFKLAAGTNLSACELLAGMWWEPAQDLDSPSRFRIGEDDDQERRLHDGQVDSRPE
jgi:transcriptional regulator with XRE-family HTH domain